MGKPSPLSRRSGGSAGGWGQARQGPNGLSSCHILAGSETVASDDAGLASLDDLLKSNHEDEHQVSQSPRMHLTEVLLSINFRRFFIDPLLFFYQLFLIFFLSEDILGT